MSRTEDQGERSAELVADVSEEGLSRVVQLCELFALPRLLLGDVDTEQALRQGARDEAEESRVDRVPWSSTVQADDEDCLWDVRSLDQNGDHDSARYSIWPAAGREAARSVAEVRNEDRLPILQHFNNWPNG